MQKQMGRQEISIMILGDHSLCFEHVIRAYYNIKTGRDTKFIMQECEDRGIETTINKRAVDLNIRVASTRTSSSRAPMDKVRVNEYDKRMKDVDIILLCFYKTNSRTLKNVQGKYLNEIKQYFPKTPYFLVGISIEEENGNNVEIMRETISIQDRFLKKELDVTKKEAKEVSKTIKSKGYLECSILKTIDYIGPNSIEFDYDLAKCKSVRDVIDKAAVFVMKRQNAPCILPFKR